MSSPAPELSRPQRRLDVELALFAALAAFGLLQWVRLFDDPPTARLAAALAIPLATAIALRLLARAGLRAAPRIAAALTLALLALAGALVAVGLPVRLLGPGNWRELGANLGEGLGGIEDSALPFGAEQVWPRLTLLLVAALILVLAAVAAFWPAHRRAAPRALGLVLLVTLYGVAVTLDSPRSELLWGVPLLLLAAAWLWLPSYGARRWLAPLALTALAGSVALPAGAAIDSERPLFDYKSWDWFAGPRQVSFDWNHSYGPLDWPQVGTPLLSIETRRPLYWKTSVLDRFDGFTWQRAGGDDALAAAEVGARAGEPSPRQLARRHPEWIHRASVEVLDLTSPLLVGTGVPLRLEGIEGARVSVDGTAALGDSALGSGDRYGLEAYSPQPSPRRLRAAPQRYPRGGHAGATLVGLPADVPDVGPSGFSPAEATRVPSWGRPPGAARERLLSSEYAATYRLAERLTAAAPSVYDAVAAVEAHLREGYDYSPSAKQHTYPLPAFLFEERSGYCQHFAGSMALMLRMLGIPARVVSGFAPGTYEASSDTYVVRDTDAHSWVEVYFRKIGWVTFDPTPSVAPAAAQTLDRGGPLVVRRDGSAAERGAGLRADVEAASEGGSVPEGLGEPGSRGRALALAGLGLAVALLAGGAGLAAHRRRRMAADEEGILRARELTIALRRLGWRLAPDATLHAIERRFERAGRAEIAAYAGALRRHRFAASSAAPGTTERRALRRALARGGGLRGRLRALRAVPPGGPAAERR